MNTPIWFSNLVLWSAQVALVAATAALLSSLFRIRQPRVLLAYWRALIVACLLLPAAQPWHRLPSPRATTSTPYIEVPAAEPATLPAVPLWHLPSLGTVAPWLGLILLAGIAVRFLFFALGLFKLRQFRRTSSPIPSSDEASGRLQIVRARVDARAEFRLSPDVDSPVTFGLASPVILLPARFFSLDAGFQEAIVCHELLHVRRKDWLHHLGEEILRAVFWFHPAIAWLISRVRLAREQVVDFEVLRVTSARKTYLDALLEFSAARARIAAIPAPLFLVERQLVERVALMVKEVRMSRGRLIASFAVITCGLAFAGVLAVWIFPLKAAPRSAQSSAANSRNQILPGRLEAGVTGGVPGGVSGGVSRGVAGNVAGGVAHGASGGVAQGVSRGVGAGVGEGVSSGIAGGAGGATHVQRSSDEPSVAYNSIWTDTVKRGPMVRQVRGLGALVLTQNSAALVAQITVPVVLTVDVRPNQSATIDTRMGLVKGHVASINPFGDKCSIDIALDAALPERATAGLSVDGIIDIEKLENVLYVGRPVHGAANTSIGLFKISKDGLEAQRVSVKLGRSSVNTIEVLDGLKAGDKIILSDTSDFDNVDRIRLTNEQPVRKP